ncbi:MAG: methylated-DNA--[protein]-cysteine S-methyltransferase [Acidimicrobiales bacterium]
MTSVPKTWLAADEQWWPIDTPFGSMLLGGDDEALHHVLLPNAAAEAARDLDEKARGRPVAVAEAESQIKEYFAGERRVFQLRVDPRGTHFQRSVWWALSDIAYGETASYGDIARRLGRPTAFRAVGMANGANPLPIVLPCHRVIGSDGSLTGFGGGLALKEALLGHERFVLARPG